MTIRNPIRRRVLRDVSRALAGMCGAMLLLSGVAVVSGAGTPSAAASVGAATALDPSTGNSDTAFAFVLPQDAGCSGDTATDGYRVQSYLVPAGAAPSALTFNSEGPILPAGVTGYSTPLLASSGNPFVNQATGVETGLLSGLPTFTFTLFLPGEVPAGDYNIGLACTIGQPGPTQLDKFWNTGFTVQVDAQNGGPAQFTYAAAEPATTTTTTLADTTTTATGETTTTTSGESTTTSSTVDPTTSTSTPASVGAGGTSSGGGFSGGSPSGPATASTIGQLPYTGNSPWSLVIWGALLLVFGRMAILLGRKPSVKGTA